MDPLLFTNPKVQNLMSFMLKLFPSLIYVTCLGPLGILTCYSIKTNTRKRERTTVYQIMNLEKTTQQLLACELSSYKVEFATLSKNRFPDEAMLRKMSDSISSGEMVILKKNTDFSLQKKKKIHFLTLGKALAYRK